MRNVCKNVSSRPTDLFCRFCWNDSARTLFPATCLPPVLKLPSAYGSLPPAAPFTQLFSQILSSHTLCSCLNILSTTKNLCNFWLSKFQQVSTYAFCSWDDIFTQKWNCSSPHNLCKCTKSPSTLSTNTSTVWNLYLSWSNQLVTSFRLEMNVGGFFWTSEQDEWYRQIQRVFFCRLCLSSQCEYCEKNFWAAVWIAGC